MKHKLQDKTCETAFTDFNFDVVYYYKKHLITTTNTIIKQVITSKLYSSERILLIFTNYLKI